MGEPDVSNEGTAVGTESLWKLKRSATTAVARKRPESFILGVNDRGAW